MYRAFFLALLSLPLLLGNLYAQKSVSPTSGSFGTRRSLGNTANLFGTKTVFIQNIGQYGDTIPQYGYMGKVLFGYEGWGLPVLFTARGVIHLHKQGNNDMKVITTEWRGANSLPEIMADDRSAGTYSYGQLNTVAHGFKKLTYRNIYPGIDLEFSFLPDKETGFEYRFLVRPDADIAVINMHYGGDARSVKDSLGNLIINSGISTIRETAPVSYYSDAHFKTVGERIVSRHMIKGKNKAFIFPDNYDHRRYLIIDPFVSGTAAALTGLNTGKVMQVDFDNAGNVYVQGGDNENGQIAKLDPAGNLLWRFVSFIPAINWRYGENFGGWTVEKTTGNVYVGQGSTGYGCSIIRLNSNTGTYDNYRTPNFADGDGNKGEIWKMRWYCNGGSPHIMIAGGSGGVGSFHDNIGVLLLPTANFVSYNVTGITTSLNQDVSDFVVDPVNNDLYSILASSNTPFVNNRIYKNVFPYIAANQRWNSLSGYPVLKEDNNTPFMAIGTNINNPGGNTNATNILAVTAKYLFYYDGKNLKAFDKATGGGIGTPLTLTWTALMQQGIFADNCDNVYIGAANGNIKVFRFNGSMFDDNAVADIPIPGYSGKAVYALAYDQEHNLLYAGGDGFVGTFDLSAWCVPPPSPPSAWSIVVNPTTAADVMASITPAPPPGTIITYTLLNGTTVISSNTIGSFTGLDATNTYTMRADFAMGCNSVRVTTQFKLKNPQLDLKITDVCGANPGSITALASEGFPPYTYSIDGINFQANNIFTALTSGTFNVIVKDATGRTASRTGSIVVNDLTVEAGNDVIICEGIFTRLSGSSNGTIISWSPSVGLNNTAVSNPTASPQATTKYYFSATKGNCSLSDSLMITVLPAPVANAGKDTSICYASGGILRGSGGVSYSWAPATYLNNAIISEPIIVQARQSVVYALQVTDAAGCRSINNDTVLLTVFPVAQVSAGSDTSIVMNQPLQLAAVDKNQSGFIQYTWFPDFGLNNALSQRPIAIIDNDITYQVTAVTSEGCTATDVVQIKVFKNPDIYVPNAFTPNGDGHNDVFRVGTPGSTKLRYLTIVNRWGQEVFRTTNPLTGWDGTLNGTLQDTGTFVWAMEAVDYTGKIIRKKGTVLLIR